MYRAHRSTEVGPSTAVDARMLLESAGQQLHGPQKIRVQRVARPRLQPQIDDVEPVGLLEAPRILRHALARIDIGQRVGFEGQRRELARDAEQRGRPAQHQRDRADDQRPAVAARRRDQRVDESGKPLAGRNRARIALACAAATAALGTA